MSANHDLTAAQRRLLEAIARSDLADGFYLTGGTALSAFYLHHRHSDDRRRYALTG